MKEIKVNSTTGLTLEEKAEMLMDNANSEIDNYIESLGKQVGNALNILINSAYEFSMYNNIYDSLGNMTDEDEMEDNRNVIELLYDCEYPIATIYEWWMHVDCSIPSELTDCISWNADRLMERLMEEN